MVRSWEAAGHSGREGGGGEANRSCSRLVSERTGRKKDKRGW